MNLIPLKEFESNLVRLFFSKCNTAEMMNSQVSSHKIYGLFGCPIVPEKQLAGFIIKAGTCHCSCSSFSSRFYIQGQNITHSTSPALMAIIAIVITLCQDDDVDDDAMVCRTHRAQRGEISGAKTEPAVPYNNISPPVAVWCARIQISQPYHTSHYCSIFIVSSDMPLCIAWWICWIAMVNYHS